MELTKEQLAEYERRATMAERERCAKICEQRSLNSNRADATAAAMQCARDIRQQLTNG